MHMRKALSRHTAVLTLALVVVGCAVYSESPVAAGNMAHAHMGHVGKAWNDTPGGKGLLPTAIAEAKIAAQHAGFAASKPDNLAWMQTHTRHVLHAVDPSVESKGPGLGYGVKKAAAGCAKHIGLAAKSDGASKNVKAHAVHIATSCSNTMARVREIAALGKFVLSSNSAADAADTVERIKVLSDQLLAGVDANGDGKITWHQDEGGLAEAAKHLGFMSKGEGMG